MARYIGWIGGVSMVLMAWAPWLEGQDFLKELENRLRDAAGRQSQPLSNEPSESPVADAPSAETKVDESVPEELPGPEQLPGPISPGAKDPSPAKPRPSPIVITPRKPQKPSAVPSPIEVEKSPTESAGYLGLTLEPFAGGGIGLAVVEVAPQSPAWKSGFRVGDRVIGIGGEAVTTIDRFADSLQSFGPGVPVKFLVQRQGRSVNLTAILQDRALAQRIQGSLLEPTTRRPSVPYQPISGSLAQEGVLAHEGGMVLGVSVSNLSEAFRQQFGIPVYRGASVSEVVVGSPAELAGIRPGDCIVEIDGRMVLFAEDVVEATRATSTGQSMVIGFYRGLQKMRVEVPVLSNAGPGIERDDIASRSREDLEEEIARLHEELDAMRRRVQELESRFPAARR